LLVQRSSPTAAAAAAASTNNNLNVEVRSDGSVRVIPPLFSPPAATNAPPR